MKQRYALRVQRGDVTAATVIGEYTINATPEGIRQLIAAMKPEFSFDILGRDGIVYSSATGYPGHACCSECGMGEKQGHVATCSKIQRGTPQTARQRVGGTFGS